MIGISEQNVRLLWSEYARPRFSTHQSQVRWVSLRNAVYATWMVLAVEAQRRGGRLSFNRSDLVAEVVQGLDVACEYCGAYFGVESWGVVRRNPLRKVQGSNVETTAFGVESVAVCCDACSLAHRIFTDEEYRDVIAALRRCDVAVAAAAVAALGKRYSPGPPACQ
jgi:hypothetical protein